MVKAKGKKAAEHAVTRVYGYVKIRKSDHRHCVGGKSGGRIRSYDGARETVRRHNKPKHSGQRFFT